MFWQYPPWCPLQAIQEKSFKGSVIQAQVVATGVCKETSPFCSLVFLYLQKLCNTSNVKADQINFKADLFPFYQTNVNTKHALLMTCTLKSSKTLNAEEWWQRETQNKKGGESAHWAAI